MALRSHAARADRNDGLVRQDHEDPRRFEQSAAHAAHIKAAVDQVQVKTKVAREAAVAVRDRFGEYQGTLRELRGQIDGVEHAANDFEGKLFEYLASKEPARLQAFTDHATQSNRKNLSTEAPGDARMFATSMLQVSEVSRNDTASAGRFEESAAHSEQIKVGIGKVKGKVELTKQAAAKVQQNFGEYHGKVTDLKTQLDEVDRQQHSYHGQLLSHFEGQEEVRMKAFEDIQSGMLGPASEEGSNATQNSSNASASEEGSDATQNSSNASALFEVRPRGALHVERQ